MSAYADNRDLTTCCREHDWDTKLIMLILKVLKSIFLKFNLMSS